MTQVAAALVVLVAALLLCSGRGYFMPASGRVGGLLRPRAPPLWSTPAQQYARAKREADRQLKEESVQRDYHKHLDLIADGDPASLQSLGSIDDWRKFAAPGVTISPSGYAPVGDAEGGRAVLDEQQRQRVNATLDHRGFVMVAPEHLRWSAHDVDMAAIAQTMRTLVENGWPPVFIFLYDQPWRMMLRLFDLMGPLLGDDEAMLEASMAAWSLEKPARVERSSSSGSKEKVGANFGVPHRDITFNNCHDPHDGSPHILSLWVPLVDVSLNNGCMFVIPRDCDPQFDRDTVKADQDPFAHRFPYAHVTPLAPAPAGTVNVWHPNLIHWGGACSSEASLPARQSIAMAFRVRDATRPSTEAEIRRYGRAPFSRRELLQGGPDYKARLRMICKSLVMYNVWYPQYDGFSLDKLDKS